MRGRESGFTIVELLVVLIIVAVLMVLIAPSVMNQKRASANPALNASAGAIWRGAQRFRVDNRGLFPPATMLTGTGAAFIDPAGERYIRRWPDGPNGRPQVLTAHTSPTPPATVAASPEGMVYYYVSPGATGGAAGWVAAYSPSGRPVFRRGAVAGALVVPAG